MSDEDRRVGAEQHPKLLAEFGGAYDGGQADYVARVGGKIAAIAGLDGRCTFTLVNSDVVNAFAVPGCYIYVTRGLLGIVNSEGELASVLAHEVGHIAGNHSNEQQRGSVLRSLGVIAIGLISGSDELTRIAGAAAGLFDLRYSRSHEYEADDYSIAYLRKAGYDPHAAAAMLAALQRQAAFQARIRGVDEARRIPEWALTHPLTENRIARAREAAEKTGLAAGAMPARRAEYLRAVDGLLYGDDPQQGFVVGRRFAHPVMRIGFTAPPGFTLTNSPQAILIEGPDGLRGEFSGGALPLEGLEAYGEAVLRRLLGRTPARIVEARPVQANGVQALVLQARAQTGEGVVPVSLAAYAGADGAAYHFLLFAPPGAEPPAELGALFGSFRLLDEAEAASLRARIVRVTTIGPGDTAQSLAARMAAAHPLDELLMLNGRASAADLRPGEAIKLVVFSGR